MEERVTCWYFSSVPSLRMHAGCQQSCNDSWFTASIALHSFIEPDRRLPLSGSSKMEYTNVLESDSGTCDVLFGVSFTSFIIFYMTFSVAGSSAPLFLPRCCKRQASDDFFTLLVTILLSPVDHSVYDLLFVVETTFRSSRFVILTSCAESLSLLFRKLFFATYA